MCLVKQFWTKNSLCTLVISMKELRVISPGLCFHTSKLSPLVPFPSFKLTSWRLGRYCCSSINPLHGADQFNPNYLFISRKKYIGLKILFNIIKSAPDHQWSSSEISMNIHENHLWFTHYTLSCTTHTSTTSMRKTQVRILLSLSQIIMSGQS